MIKYKKFLLDQFTPVSIYHKAKDYFKGEISFLFESAINKSTGSFSFIIIGANETLISKNYETTLIKSDGTTIINDKNPFEILKKYYQGVDKNYHKKIIEECGVGYVDGFIGYIGYDTVKFFEPSLKPCMDTLSDNMNLPDMYMIRPKLIIAYSHKDSTISLISSIESMQANFEHIENVLKSDEHYLPLLIKNDKTIGSLRDSKDDFFKKIEEGKEHIRSGDVFQILISSQYSKKTTLDPFSFYRILRTKNPSPYLFLLEFKDFGIAGSSPEVMVRLHDGEILLRPIAGTRKRGKNPKRDHELEDELKHDTKELAEHLMLVDLGRNDVGRVAKPKSVKVPELMRVERYSHVMHLVSDVIAEIEDDKDMFDLFAATFTAGTMTGAPKVKAMELIAKIEGHKRGFYSGSIGYFGFDGNMDSAITIRTALFKDGNVFIQAGAGVVADSKPELEYLEVNNKMGALISSIEELMSK